MILSFTPNPAMDETYLTSQLKLDASHRVTLQHRQAGGKGINVAKVLHSQSIDVEALCPLGGSLGEEFAQELKHRGIALTPIRTSVPTRRSMAFHDAQENITSIFNEAGTALEAEDWAGVEKEYEALLPKVRGVAICGSWPPGTAKETISRLIKAATGREIWTIVDTSGPNLLLAAGCGAVLKPNDHELREATGCASLSEGARELLRLGAPEVYVSAGAQGLYHFTSKTPEVAHAKLNRTLSGNPTGAGDSAVAAIASRVEHQLNREAVLRRAVAWSAATVLMPNAGVLSPRHLELLGNTSYRIIPASQQL
ncbi:1-phosphofructokinase family hexose kinase [Glutamicibacter sp.]|uniref:1-phosphofructokinase family hexose kinase n=1 Tax=Glutamicibacter sp. TaxID=1931995 RepID=UPI003D6BA55B